MSDKGWKKFERRMSRDVGTERIPVTGERAGADARSEMFAYQFKHRSHLPDWLWNWLDPIRATAKKQNQIGVLVVKRPGMHDTRSVVVLSWADWCDLHGRSDEPAPVSPGD